MVTVTTAMELARKLNEVRTENERLRAVNTDLLLALEGTLLGCEAHGLGGHPIAQQARDAIAKVSSADFHPPG